MDLLKGGQGRDEAELWASASTILLVVVVVVVFFTILGAW